MDKISFEEFIVNVAKVIRDIRKEKGITQSTVAKAIGKPQSTVARFESSGVNDSHISLVFHLCDAIDENIADVLGRAMSISGAQRGVESSDLDGRWEVVKDKMALLEGRDREEALVILESVLRMVEGK